NEGFAQRLREDRERAAQDRATLEVELKEAGEALEQRQQAESAAREAVQQARARLEELERMVREHRDQLRRLEMDREGADREAIETEQRRNALDEERQQLANILAATKRELVEAGEQVAVSQYALDDAQAALEQARRDASIARTRDAEARSQLAAAVEHLTSLEAKMSALEALERERVGLAPSAAQLLKERDRFGEGAVLGPLTDFVSADSDAARL